MNNQELIKLRNEIMDCFTCDEEVADGGDSVIESRIDEVLMKYKIEEHNRLAMIQLENKIKYSKTLNSFKFDDLFGKSRTLTGDFLKLYFKQLIDRELLQFKVSTLTPSDIFWDNIGFFTKIGCIGFHLREDYNNFRYINVRVEVTSKHNDDYIDYCDCFNPKEFKDTVEKYLNLI